MANRGTQSQQESGRPFSPAQRFQKHEEEEEDVQFELAEEKEGDGSEPEHLTKSGKPDRRYSEYRGLPPPEKEEINPNYTKPTVGGFDPDLEMHITKDGRPDRRFKENRGKSDDEVMSEWAEKLYDKYVKH